MSVTADRGLGDVRLAARRCDEAIASFEHSPSLSPDSVRLHDRIALGYLYKGDIEHAAQHAAQEPVEWVRELIEILILRRRGDTAAWSEAAVAYEARYGYASACQLAEIYADAGDLDKAFEWLGIAERVRDPGGPWALVAPHVDEARKDPRWAAVQSAFKLEKSES